MPPDRGVDYDKPGAIEHPDDREHADRLMDIVNLPRHIVSIWYAASNCARLDFVLLFDDEWRGDIPEVPEVFEGHRVFLARQGRIVAA